MPPVPQGEESEGDPEEILRQLDDTLLQRELRPGVVIDLEHPDEYDSSALKAQALSNVQSAFKMLEENVSPRAVTPSVPSSVCEVVVRLPLSSSNSRTMSW